MTADQLIEQALTILADLGFPRAQQNERSAVCLLAITDMRPGKTWSDAGDPLVGITPMMEFARDHFGKTYAPNTRETFRRQTMHQFVDGGLALYNPDNPGRPVNSPKAVYQIPPEALDLLKCVGAADYPKRLKIYLSGRDTLTARYAAEREFARLPVEIANGETIKLSAGEHSELIKAIVEEFASRFLPGCQLIYVGDTGDKIGFFDADRLAKLGVTVDTHGKMPDVVFYDVKRNWLVLVEAVTSHGPVDGKRRDELKKLFGHSTAGLVYVTGFPTRAIMGRYLGDIAWD